MKVVFTVPASRLMYHMFVEPNALWQNAQQFTCSKLEEHDKFACIARLAENKLIGPLGIGDAKVEESVATTLLDVVKKGSAKERNEAWRGVVNLLTRPFLSVPINMKKDYIDFIKSVVTHYSTQKMSGVVSQGFSDLSHALDGHEPLNDAEMPDDDGKDAIEEEVVTK
jgi:hypothetical protein